MRLSLVLTTVVLFLASCSAFTTKFVQYDIGLDQVERPEDALERYGEYVIEKSDSADVSRYLFEDNLVGIVWVATGGSIAFELENKTSHSLKIIWDEAVFIDVDGTSGRIMHSGVKYIDRNSSQPPTVVARGSRITDIILPTDRVRYVEGQYGGWREDPIVNPYSSTDVAMLQRAKENVGRSFRILLALEIEGVVNEYIFSFKIYDAEVPSPTTR